MSGIEELVRSFVDAAAAYCAAVESGDPKTAKMQQERATAAYRGLRDRNERGRLLVLLASDNIAVRYMAAVHALDFTPVDGERVLTNITNGPPSPVRLLAQVSLSQWRSGLLHF